MRKWKRHSERNRERGREGFFAQRYPDVLKQSYSQSVHLSIP